MLERATMVGQPHFCVSMLTHCISCTDLYIPLDWGLTVAKLDENERFDNQFHLELNFNFLAR